MLPVTIHVYVAGSVKAASVVMSSKLRFSTSPEHKTSSDQVALTATGKSKMSMVVDASAMQPNWSIAVNVTSPKLADVPSTTVTKASGLAGEPEGVITNAAGTPVLFQE